MSNKDDSMAAVLKQHSYWLAGCALFLVFVLGGAVVLVKRAHMGGRSVDSVGIKLEKFRAQMGEVVGSICPGDVLDQTESGHGKLSVQSVLGRSDGATLFLAQLGHRTVYFWVVEYTHTVLNK